METRRRWYPALLVISLVLAGLGAYRQYDARRAPDQPTTVMGTAPRLVPAPLTVSVSIPGVGTGGGTSGLVSLGNPTPIAVDVAGPTIAEVRLFDGAELVGVQRFTPARSNRVSVRMLWPALRPGFHVLHAQARSDDSAEVGRSAPVRLRAVPGVVPVRQVRLAANGRTAAEVASSIGVPVASLRLSGARGVRIRPPSGPLPAGVTAQVRISEVRALPQVATAAAGQHRTDLDLDARLDGCRVVITPRSGGAVTVYELTGAGPGFVDRGSATASTPYRSPDLTPGTHVFTAGEGSGAAASAPVAVEVPDRCLEDLWSGGASLLDGTLRLAKPESQVWIYLGVDGQPFRRVPADGAASAAFGSADLAPSIPSLRGRTLRMEVWRPGASPGAPAELVTRSQATLPSTDLVSDLIGSGTGVSLTGPAGTDPLDLGRTATSVRLSWSTDNLTTTGVIWQVLGRPLAATDRNTAPPVLLATGSSQNGDGLGIQLSGRGGSFEIPAALLLGGRPASGPVADVLQQVPAPALSDLVKPGAQFGVQPVRAPTTATPLGLGAGLVPVPVGDVYVRVLPTNGASVLGDASNTLAVRLPDLTDGTAGFTDPVVSFDPGVAANEELRTCIRVTGVPVTGGGLFYPHDGTYCPADFAGKGGGCQGWCQVASDVGSLVGFVGKAWDYIASAYNTVVDTIVEVIARFNPFCLTASVASALSESPYAATAADGCEKVASVVAAVVVSVVLSSFGLPAKLPTSKEVGDIAAGDLTALAVAYLEQLGVPCSEMTVDATTVDGLQQAGVSAPQDIRGPGGAVDVCAAMVAQTVQAIRAQVQEATVAEVSNITGLPAPPAPATMQLEPRGRYHGATVHLTATPIDPKTPLTSRCFVSARGTVPPWNVGGFEGTKVRSIGYGGGSVTYHGFGALAGEPWSGDIEMRPIDDLYAFETIGVSFESPCFAPGSLPSVPATPLRPALGRWLPGEVD